MIRVGEGNSLHYKWGHLDSLDDSNFRNGLLNAPPHKKVVKSSKVGGLDDKRK